jgi:hypothetical protein
VKHRAIAAGLVAALLLTACSGERPNETDPQADAEVGIIEVTDEDAYGEECGAAVEQAAAMSDMEDSVEDLDLAIVACDDLGELRTATDDHPTALDGVDLETFVSNRCMYAEDGSATGAAICAEVSR